MAFTPKAWQKFPLKTTPINDVALKALEQRAVSYATAESVSPGAFGWEDFRVKQRGAGANNSVDVGLAATEMNAWVRDAALGIYRYQYNGAQLNVAVTAADATNPRIDRIVMTAPSSSDSIVPQIVALTGAATIGATLDTLTGAAAVPAGYVLLADILMPALAAGALTANIRDRRPVGGEFASGGVLPFGAAQSSGAVSRDEVYLIPHQSLVVGGQTFTPTTHDNMQGAYLARLPRRIVNATRLRWRYAQGATPAATNHVIGLYDSSGRVVIVSGLTAFAGGANTVAEQAISFTAQTFEPADYFVFVGLAALTAASALSFTGVQGNISVTAPGSPFRNVKAHSAAGGTTAPNTLVAFTDVAAQTAAANNLPLPIVSLSVG